MMKTTFLKNFFRYVLIYIPIMMLIQVTTGGTIQELLDPQHLFQVIFFGVFMALIIPLLTKKI